MSDQEKRIEILRKIEQGELSALEGFQLLKETESQYGNASMGSLGGDTVNFTAAMPAVQTIPTVPLPSETPLPPGPVHAPVLVNLAPTRTTESHEAPPADRKLADELKHWKRWWMIPFWVGVAITIIGSGLVYWGYSAAHFGWGFWLAWLPFIFGLVVMILGWQSQTAHWLHIRIRQKPGEKPGQIIISMPLPLRLAAWLLRRFGPFVPNIREKGVADILTALDQSISSDAPFYVNVDDKDGEHVEVFIG